jgi:hypothetical protein
LDNSDIEKRATGEKMLKVCQCFNLTSQYDKEISELASDDYVGYFKFKAY